MRSRLRAAPLFALFASAVFALPIFADDGRAAATPAASTPAAAANQELTIFAASSLQEAFRALGDRFTKARGIAVDFSFAGSQELRTQLEQGAKADLFASADRRHPDALEKEGLADAPRLFARNSLVIAVPKGNPGRVHELADLAHLKHIVIGAHEVPVGNYAEKLFAAAEAKSPGLQAQLEARISSRELNVRQVLAKVSLGEADAGIVYRTDAFALAAQVDSVALPADLEQRTEDFISPLKQAANPGGAAAFVEFLLSEAGQSELRAQGFLAVGAP